MKLIRLCLYCFFSGAACYLSAQTYNPVITGYTVIPGAPVSGQPYQIALSVTAYQAMHLYTFTMSLDQISQSLTVDCCYSMGWEPAPFKTYVDTLFINNSIAPGTYPITFMIYRTSESCSGTAYNDPFSSTLTLMSSVGIGESSHEKEIALYYENRTERLILNNKERYVELKLLDLTGRVIKTWRDPQHDELSLAGIPPACYLVEARSANGLQRAKVIKN